MSFSLDDPRLTAYALGELDEAERLQLEAELADSPEGQRAVEEIRAAAATLSRGLAAAPPELSENRFAEVRKAIDKAVNDCLANGAVVADASSSDSKSPPVAVPVTYAERRMSDGLAAARPRRSWVALALAACVLVAVGVTQWLPEGQSGRDARLLSVADVDVSCGYFPLDDVHYAQSHDGEKPSGGSNEVVALRGMRGRGTETKEIGYTVAKPAYAKGSKDIAYTVAKPVHDKKGADAAPLYVSPQTENRETTVTVNGTTQTVKVPVTVTKSSAAAGSEVSGQLEERGMGGGRFGGAGMAKGADFGAATGGEVNKPLSASASERSPQFGDTFDVTSDAPFDSFGRALDLSQTDGKAIDDLKQRNLVKARAWYDSQATANVNNPAWGFRENKRELLAAYRGELLRQRQEQLLAEQEHNTEAYARIVDNAFLKSTENPLSTFSIDVDTASYANVRRFLKQGTLPPPDAVRIEELLNYFTYDYAPPADDKPFAVHSEVASCPWNDKHRLLRIGLKGKEIKNEQRPASNLVFLLDVSGSMDEPNKLPLVKSGIKLLVDQLGENDRVAIVVYAGASGLVLDSTTGDQKESILASIDQLNAGGSTNGGEGIELAYGVAAKHFITGGTNRVILCTDGDFNVGVTNQGDLTRLIEDKAKGGVFLSVLGFGDGNLKDQTMEQLADRGNGNYSYVDTLSEARKVFVEQTSGTLVTIAKDVKIQVEFNPAQVAAYRLIGYENRMLAKEDFNDDTKDAGEIGAGHTVTALYEIVPAGEAVAAPRVDELKYQQTAKLTDAAASGDLLTLKLRYKAPDGKQSTPLEFPVRDAKGAFGQAGVDFKFASAVAAFGMLLRDSPHKGNATYDAVLEIAGASLGDDKSSFRKEFLELVKQAKGIGK